MVRKFSLVAINDFDEDIDRFNLDDVSNPQGVGFEIEYTSIESHLTTIFTSAKEKKVATQMTVIFTNPSAYAKSSIFKSFVQKYVNKRVILEYKNSDEILNWEGKITKCGITELNKFGELECPISFLPGTPKYVKRENSITIQRSSKGMNFPLKLPFCFGKNLIKNNLLQNNYFDKIPLRIFVYGDIINPQISLIDTKTSEVYSRIWFAGNGGLTLDIDEHILIDAITNKILLWRGGKYISAYDYLNNSNDYDTFAWAKEDTLSELHINLGAESKGYLKASYREYKL